MHAKIIVVDDFYANPDAVRESALRGHFQSASHYNYPGWQSDRALHTEALKEALGRIIGQSLVVDTDRFTWGGFRLISERTGRLTKVHADTGVDWAGMVYLTPRAPMSAGTGFFRHRESDLAGPPADAEARQWGFADAAQFERDVARRDMAKLDRWKLESWVGPLYNRLVLFRGCELYHAPLGGCGDAPDNARLTHNFFFNEELVPSFVSALDAS